MMDEVDFCMVSRSLLFLHGSITRSFFSDGPCLFVPVYTFTHADGNCSLCLRHAPCYKPPTHPSSAHHWSPLEKICSIVCTFSPRSSPEHRHCVAIERLPGTALQFLSLLRFPDTVYGQRSHRYRREDVRRGRRLHETLSSHGILSKYASPPSSSSHVILTYIVPGSSNTVPRTTNEIREAGMADAATSFCCRLSSLKANEAACSQIVSI